MLKNKVLTPVTAKAIEVYKSHLEALLTIADPNTIVSVAFERKIARCDTILTNDAFFVNADLEITKSALGLFVEFIRKEIESLPKGIPDEASKLHTLKFEAEEILQDLYDVKL